MSIFHIGVAHDPEKTAKTTFNPGSGQAPERHPDDQPCPNCIVDPKAAAY